MTQYAKYISETEVQYPTSADFPGIPHFIQHDSALRKKQFFPLHDIPEDREGYRTVLDKFRLTSQTKPRTEPRQVLVEDWEEDPETHERRKTGEHYEMQDVTFDVDDSYITVLESHYEEIPAPEPESAPDTTERDDAERAIVTAIVGLAQKYNAMQDLLAIEDITIPNLRSLAVAKGVPDAEFGALITELTPYKWQLEAVTGLPWAEEWSGLKERFSTYVHEIIG